MLRARLSRGFSISPDGTRLVIEAVSRGHRRLYLRPLDSEKAVELENTTGAQAPFWSPDSRFIAFFADGKLKKIPAAGGPPEELCDGIVRHRRELEPGGHDSLLADVSPPGDLSRFG